MAFGSLVDHDACIILVSLIDSQATNHVSYIYHVCAYTSTVEKWSQKATALSATMFEYMRA